MINQELVERNVETTTFKPKGKEKLMNHVYSEYSDKELENIYSLLSGGSFNFDIQLNIGEKIVGKVAGETPTHYLFDIGYKDYIHIEKRRFLVGIRRQSIGIDYPRLIYRKSKIDTISQNLPSKDKVPTNDGILDD